VTAEDINHLIDLIKEHIETVEGGEEQIKDALKYFNNTKNAVKFKREENGRFKAINIWWGE
jgi:hypothetical protein